jgi:glucose dehydrogenase
LQTGTLWRGATLVWLLGSAFAQATADGAGNVDAARLEAADSEPQNWFTGGRDKDGTYFSPLSTIDAGNVKQLGFAWSYDLGEPQRGLRNMGLCLCRGCGQWQRAVAL